ncbi:Exostosin-2 [Taenia crassiceps]|uniref:Exostosin-2 n=1 Tax=Taenia crassiceps TaxID=6207 RepID=A0ABR4QPF0_9CEST
MLGSMICDKRPQGISAIRSSWFSRRSLKLCFIVPVLLLIMLLFFLTRPLEPVSELAMLAFRVYRSQRFLYGSCSHHTCFNVELCEYEYPDSIPSRIRVYVYPELMFVDEDNNRMKYYGDGHFRELLDAVNSSKYAVNDPSKACLFVSSLNFEGNSLLSSLELLIFDLDYARSFDNNRFNLQSFPGMVAGSRFELSDYRSTYDVSLPVVSSFQHPSNSKLEVTLVVTSKATLITYFNIIGNLTVLESSLFCLVDQMQPPNTLLFDVMQAGCIPILLDSDVVLPFSEKLDWARCSLSIPQSQLENLVDVISTYSNDEIGHLQRHVNFFYSKYMSSLTAIVTTTLDIINSRVFPHNTPSYYDWNDPPLPSPTPSLEVSFPSNGQAICNRFTLLLVTGSHIKYLVSTLRFMANSKYIREAFIIWRSDMADVASPFFVQQGNLHVPFFLAIFLKSTLPMRSGVSIQVE